MKIHDLTELQWVRAATVSGEARRIRVGAGVAQAEIAVTIDVAPSTVALWEAGKRRPTGSAALRYAATLRSLARASEASGEARSAAPA